MEENKHTHRSTARVLDILELIARHPDKYNLTEICTITDSPKSSLYPIISTLNQRHFLSLKSDGKYTIGYKAYQVGQCYLNQLDFLEEVEHILTNITNVCLETSHFATLADGNVMYLKKIDSPESIRMISHVGFGLPAYGTALGKALLMDCSSEDLAKIYPDGLKPITSHTITDLSELYKQLLIAREEGFTYEVEESNQHIRCIGIPVRKAGSIVAAASVAVPTFRYDAEKEALIKSLLLDTKKKIESILNNLDLDFQSLINSSM